MAINRFRQLKEEEKRKKLTKVLPEEEVQSSASDLDEESDVESTDKVVIRF